ncbi:hypothetical protein AOLI_G00107530 [Acnodon oligacanthus]
MAAPETSRNRLDDDLERVVTTGEILDSAERQHLGQGGVECKTFFKIVTNHLMRFLLKNTYIDTLVQKGGVPGVSGCIEHTGAITQLIREAHESKGDLAVL